MNPRGGLEETGPAPGHHVWGKLCKGPSSVGHLIARRHQPGLRRQKHICQQLRPCLALRQCRPHDCKRPKGKAHLVPCQHATLLNRKIPHQQSTKGQVHHLALRQSPQEEHLVGGIQPLSLAHEDLPCHQAKSCLAAGTQLCQTLGSHAEVLCGEARQVSLHHLLGGLCRAPLPNVTMSRGRPQNQAQVLRGEVGKLAQNLV
mmetsp:Transcript_56408/g.134683  ORF Transcript_56408/g.134683 Transcript_56408/m.134683 type:complete len:202 (+) Transcript_56408:884-1489(+)